MPPPLPLGDAGSNELHVTTMGVDSPSQRLSDASTLRTGVTKRSAATNRGRRGMVLLASLPLLEARKDSSPLTRSNVKRRPNGNDGGDNDGDDDDDEDGNNSKAVRTLSLPEPFILPTIRIERETTSAAATITFSHLAKLSLRIALTTTVALYFLNQQHLLPEPLSAFVSKALFWPTLPITFSRRRGKWCTVLDDVVVFGGAPIALLGFPERLYQEYGVRGVINMCSEYCGPTHKYQKLGIEELHLPTTDHFEPSVEDMKRAVAFIKVYESSKKGRVYVHCRAGHGRSAAIAYAWLITKYPELDMRELNEKLCQLRHVRKGLWLQPNIKLFKAWLTLNKGKFHGKYSRNVPSFQSTERGEKEVEWIEDFDHTAATDESEESTVDFEDGNEELWERDGGKHGLFPDPLKIKKDLQNWWKRQENGKDDEPFYDASEDWSEGDEQHFQKVVESDITTNSDLEDEKDYQMWKEYHLKKDQ